MEMNKGYKHVDTEEKYISLHDCYATKLRTKDNILSAYFGEGFWILDKHEFNDYGKTLKTDSAYVEFHIDEFDEIKVYLFKNAFNGETLRVEKNLDSFIKSVNDGVYELEFLYQYLGYNGHIIECVLHSDKEPYHYECQLYIPAHKTLYCWNSLCEENVW